MVYFTATFHHTLHAAAVRGITTPMWPYTENAAYGDPVDFALIAKLYFCNKYSSEWKLVPADTWATARKPTYPDTTLAFIWQLDDAVAMS